jgi:hypothetical protein
MGRIDVSGLTYGTGQYFPSVGGPSGVLLPRRHRTESQTTVALPSRAFSPTAQPATSKAR